MRSWSFSSISTVVLLSQPQPPDFAWVVVESVAGEVTSRVDGGVIEFRKRIGGLGCHCGRCSGYSLCPEIEVVAGTLPANA